MLIAYNTIKKETGPIQIKEKGSRFIAYAYPVSQKDEAENAILALRKKYHDATHVCFAYRIGEGVETILRYSDDGEPSGTAGMPIYNEIKRKDLYNVAIAVVRYFGGVKLGTGGLSRAFSSAAREIIDNSSILKIPILRKIKFDVPYSLFGEMIGLINQLKIDIISQSYTQETATFEIEVSVSNYEITLTAINDRSGGRARIEGS
jgi:uncharacterized YigZ family protein